MEDRSVENDAIFDTLCRVCLDVKRCKAALMFLTRMSFGHSCLSDIERRVEALAVNELRERLRLIETRVNEVTDALDDEFDEGALQEEWERAVRHFRDSEVEQVTPHRTDDAGGEPL